MALIEHSERSEHGEQEVMLKPEDLIPKMIFTPEITFLLDLREKGIEDFSEIGKLDQRINRLDLSGNHIKSLNNIEILGKLPDLRYLFLGNNEIQHVPDVLKFSTLLNLSLTSNRIHQVDALTGLDDLAYLDINDNQITSLEGFLSLESLRSLNIADNRIASLSGVEREFIKKLIFASNEPSINLILQIYGNPLPQNILDEVALWKDQKAKMRAEMVWGYVDKNGVWH